jgi:phage shock protein C
MNEVSNFRDLKKSATDSKIAGVCGGFGEHTEIPSWLWRVIFVVSLFLGGLGLLTYIVLWVCMPAAENVTYRERVVNPEAAEK